MPADGVSPVRAEPFGIRVDAAVIDDLRTRIRKTRLPGIQEVAVRAICGRLTAVQLQEMQRSVEQACLIPKHIGWDRKATAHAELFALLADSAGDPVLAQVLNLGAGIAHHLMVTAGASAGGITANSCKRILAACPPATPTGRHRK